MAFEDISLFARLWQKLGVRLLLRETPVPVQDSLLTYGLSRDNRPKRPASTGARGGPQGTRAPFQSSRPERVIRSTPPLSKKQDSARPAECWPKAWQNVLTLVQPGRVVWSYSSLGMDLLHRESSGRDERRRFLGRILSQKPNYPQGTHTFWPYCLPDDRDASLLPAPSLFFQGVRALGGQVVFLLGPDAGQALLSFSTPYAFKRVDGVLCTVFQDIDVLAQDQILYQRMQEYVREVLTSVNIYPV